MASEIDSDEISSLFERLLGQDGSLSLLLSLILGFSSSETREDPDQELPDQSRGRLIMIDPFTRTVFVIRSGLDDALLNDIVSGKQGRPPAAKSAVEAMRRVEIGEEEEDDGACVICLEEWSEGDTAAEMPCKHRFHVKCIEEWLGIHGTCPVCRFEMPVEEEEEEGKRIEREILVRFSINGAGGTREAGEGEAAASDDGSGSNPRNETEG